MDRMTPTTEYGKLGKSGSMRSTSSEQPPNNPRKRQCKIGLILAAILLVAGGLAGTIAVVTKKKNDGGGSSMHDSHPSQAMSKACNHTRYPSVCVDSLLEYPGATSASELELVTISINVTLQNVGQALGFATEFASVEIDPQLRTAQANCMQLLDHTQYLLTNALNSKGSNDDVLTWLSAALTNQDTCEDSLEEVKVGDGGDAWAKVSGRMSELTKSVRNSLNMYADNHRSDLPPQAPSRRLLSHENQQPADFPAWLTRQDRLLLNTPVSQIKPDVIVSSSGVTGTVKTISEAIQKAPDNSAKRFIIYVMEGRYEEKNLVLGKEKTKIMLVGEGQLKTIITGGKSVQDQLRTFDTASFAATGDDFMARDIAFENYAGPSKHQAVALRVESDRSIFYKCSFLGYQDTLYARAQRQFYKECNIEGTVDFIFGNAAAVFQGCTIVARKPMPGQSDTITAVRRMDPDQNTGFSIHASHVVPAKDLGSVPTYLGRPWKAYARAVFMQSDLGGHINPAGWLEWDGGFGLDTLYYGEYMNKGPGAGVGQRVKWPGYHVITSVDEANKFTVDRFIQGATWLPASGVPYEGGLVK